MSWLDRFFTNKNYGTIQINGVPLPPEAILNIIGATGADDPTNQRTTITISGGGGGGGLPITSGALTALDEFAVTGGMNLILGTDGAFTPGATYKYLTLVATDGIDWSVNGTSQMALSNAGGTMNNGGYFGFLAAADPTVLPTVGNIRFPYNGGASVDLMAVVDSVGTTRPILRFGAGDAAKWGNTLLDTLVDGYSYQGNFPNGLSTITHVGFQWYASAAIAYQFELNTDGSVRFLLGERHKLVEKDADYAFTVAIDYHICALAGLTTATLPATGGDGDTYEVSNISGGAITVDGNGTNIYKSGGAVATESLADAEVAVYRYNAGTLGGTAYWVRIA